MKIHIDFITNSSSASFVLWFETPVDTTESEINKELGLTGNRRPSDPWLIKLGSDSRGQFWKLIDGTLMYNDEADIPESVSKFRDNLINKKYPWRFIDWQIEE